MQPSDQELAEFSRGVDRARKMLHDLPDNFTEVTSVYFPARITQAKNLTQNASDDFQTVQAHHADMIGEGAIALLREMRTMGVTSIQSFITFGQPGSPDQPVTHEPKWLDFTQFELSPYFTGLFADEERISVTKGRIDIVLRREPGAGRMYDCHKLPELADLKSLIGSMYFTNPPCKQVTVGMWVHSMEARLQRTNRCHHPPHLTSP
jgi:hypothetical protein